MGLKGFSVLFFYDVTKNMLILKVSKSQKQIILFSHTPKNQRKFSHFFALGSKKPYKVAETKDKSLKILI